jgi:hypothetical protein
MNFKKWFLKEVNIDNKDGWGQTPKNASIDYYGIRVKKIRTSCPVRTHD